MPRAKNGPALAGHGAEAVRDAIARTIVTLPDERRGVGNRRSAELVRVARLIVCCGEIGREDRRCEISQRRVRSPEIEVCENVSDASWRPGLDLNQDGERCIALAYRSATGPHLN